MSVALYLDHLERPHTTHLTNLDFVSGKVILTLQTEASISGIQVKLEAESRTRLAGPRYPHNEHSEKKRTELEVHKVWLSFILHFVLERCVLIEFPSFCTK